MMTNYESKEKRIKQLELACDSIKENAADFIGNEEFRTNVTISIVLEANAVPVIRLERESLPEKLLKSGADAL